MSLINKMLQDLEARRADDVLVKTTQGQVRAAPESTGIHAAWWIVLALLISLTGTLSWIWGRTTAPVVVVQKPELALKLAPGLTLPAGHSTLPQGVQAVPVAVPMPRPIQATAPALPHDTAPAAASTVPAVAAIAPPVSIPEPGVTPAPKAAPAKTEVAVLAPAVAPRQSNGKTAVAKSSSIADTRSDDENAAPMPMTSNVAKQIKELTPAQRAENEYRKAIISIQQGRPSEAQSALELALQLDSQHAAARQTLVGLLVDAKRTDEAIRKLQDGLTLDVTQSGMAMILARLQLDKGDLRAALQTLTRSLPHASERPDYLAFLAALLQRDGRHKDAVDQYMNALRRSPQNGVWWMGLGISLQAENRSAEARDAFGRAKASNSLSPDLVAFVDKKVSELPR